MKSVMLSIKPKYCELIASGKKTIEVRKTRPKIETPFKCYIYCTKDKTPFLLPTCLKGNLTNSDIWQKGNGKVIGEFVCDAIFTISITYSDPESRIALKEFPYTCLTDKQIMNYLGNGKQGYGWHISNLKIYDKPKRLSEFRHCGVKVGAKVSRPPQSWCYVEEQMTVGQMMAAQYENHKKAQEKSDDITLEELQKLLDDRSFDDE